MKINGKRLDCPNIVTIVLPRSSGEDVVFKAKAVLDAEDFERLCPPPKPPTMIRKGFGRVEDIEDPRYKAAMEERNTKRFDWIIIQSLRATDGLEWEKVKYSDSNTWHLYKEELREAGLGDYEIQRLIRGVLEANCLDETKMEEARNRFLLGQVKGADGYSSLTTEQASTPSGEPVNGSVSALPK